MLSEERSDESKHRFPIASGSVGGPSTPPPRLLGVIAQEDSGKENAKGQA